MAWKEETAMSNKKLFVKLALEQKDTVSALCKVFNISRECGYKWLRRYKEFGPKGLEELSRKPLRSPSKTSMTSEQEVLKVRNKHPAWGSRKIHAYLKRFGDSSPPAPSTINRVLHRHSMIDEAESIKHTAFLRFEHAMPNQLWQMDFKGCFVVNGERCNPLTVLDDHSRYSLCLEACKNQQTVTVQEVLTRVFKEYGLPERMTMDNGSPWACPSEIGFTTLEVWLIRLGIYVTHSRPYHPQTQGKDERFHRSLKEEVLKRASFQTMEEIQKRFSEWRECYNNERPHEALGLNPPASRYRASIRRYLDPLPPIGYEEGSVVKKVQKNGIIRYMGHIYFISQSIGGLPVKIVETNRDGILEVYLNHQKVREIDLINKLAAKKII